MVLYFSHYLLTSIFEAADEIMDKVQVKMDLKTKNSSKKVTYVLKNLC